MNLPKKITILAILILFNLVLNSQNSVYNEFKICPLGIAYKYDEHSIVKTENKVSDTFYTSKYGHLTSLDTRFPLKKLAYFKESNSILVLNNRFGIVTHTQLDKIGLFESLFVTYSSDGLIWVFDRVSNRLLKINENNDVKFQTDNPFFYKNKAYFPTQYLDLKTKNIALDTSFGLFILDSYGNLLETIPSASISKVFVIQSFVFLIKDGQLFQLDYENNKIKSVKTTAPIDSIKSLFYSEGSFYYFDGIENRKIAIELD
jgi:hypothetical protein